MEISKLMDFGKLIADAKIKHIGPMFHHRQFGEKMGGMRGRLVTIAGFSGSCKTTYALDMAYYNATKLGYTSVFLSLEMEPSELWKKLLLRHSENHKFTRYRKVDSVNGYDWSGLSIDNFNFLKNIVAEDFKKNMAYGHIIIVSTDDLVKHGIDNLLPAIEKDIMASPFKDKYWGIDLFFVDYIQLLGNFLYHQYSQKNNRYQFVGDVIRYLKFLTQTYKTGMNNGIDVIALSQINREGYKYARDSKDKDKGYDLTSIAESSEIVNASDIVITLRYEIVNKKGHCVKAQLLKNRFGETIDEPVQLLSLPEYCYVGDYREASQEEMDNIVDELIGA